MTASLAKKELQRVGRRLDRRRQQRGDRPLVVVLDVDAAALELAVDGVRLEGVEPVGVDELRELGRANEAGRLTRLEQLVQVLALGEGLEIDRRFGRLFANASALRFRSLALAQSYACRLRPWSPSSAARG